MNARRWLCFLLVCLVAGCLGYWRGAQVTNLECRTRMAELDTRHAAEDRARAEAVALAEKNARERLQTEVSRGHALSMQLETAQAELDTERASINQRIADVSQTAARDCRGLGADWVRVYNEALGLASATRSHSGAGSQSPGAAGTVASPAGAESARAGVQRNALTTPQDVLAHVRDYGAYCRKLASGYRALVAWETP